MVLYLFVNSLMQVERVAERAKKNSGPSKEVKQEASVILNSLHQMRTILEGILSSIPLHICIYIGGGRSLGSIVVGSGVPRSCYFLLHEFLECARGLTCPSTL